MNLREAIEHCRRYDSHQWVYETTWDGIIVVGGTDRRLAVARARRDGYCGPIYQWDYQDEEAFADDCAAREQARYDCED